MLTRTLLPLFALLCWMSTPADAASSPYRLPANAAALWLESQQNRDGSWGEVADIRLLDTVEAVLALRAVGRRSNAYFSGIAWLENHPSGSVDFAARRVFALSDHGDNLAADLAYLRGARAADGWGLTADYLGSPLDSAITLLASRSLRESGAPASYLRKAQLALGAGNRGWSLAQSDTSDAVTTALVVMALLNDGEPLASTTIQNAISTLNTRVGPGSSPPAQALTAMALLRAGSDATALLNSLLDLQSAVDGSINTDVYSTALALRSFAAAMGADAAVQATQVTITDPALRAALNTALGRNRMDAIDRAELARLTTLNAADSGITNLTGLEFAVNLKILDLRNNSITSTAPLATLSALTRLSLSGNPVVSQGSGEVPMLPPWALVSFAGLLIVALRRWSRATQVHL